MISNKATHIYSVSIPSTALKEVIEWFEIMDNSNQLSEALIELVNVGIKSGRYQNTVIFDTTTQGQEPIIETEKVEHQNNFMDGLYDWQNSINSIFNEGKEDKKEKKRMLTV